MWTPGDPIEDVHDDLVRLAPAIAREPLLRPRRELRLPLTPVLPEPLHLRNREREKSDRVLTEPNARRRGARVTRGDRSVDRDRRHRLGTHVERLNDRRVHPREVDDVDSLADPPDLRLEHPRSRELLSILPGVSVRLRREPHPSLDPHPEHEAVDERGRGRAVRVREDAARLAYARVQREVPRLRLDAREQSRVLVAVGHHPGALLAARLPRLPRLARVECFLPLPERLLPDELEGPRALLVTRLRGRPVHPVVDLREVHPEPAPWIFDLRAHPRRATLDHREVEQVSEPRRNLVVRLDRLEELLE